MRADQRVFVQLQADPVPVMRIRERDIVFFVQPRRRLEKLPAGIAGP